MSEVPLYPHHFLFSDQWLAIRGSKLRARVFSSAMSGCLGARGTYDVRVSRL